MKIKGIVEGGRKKRRCKAGRRYKAEVNIKGIVEGGRKKRRCKAEVKMLSRGEAEG